MRMVMPTVRPYSGLQIGWVLANWSVRKFLLVNMCYRVLVPTSKYYFKVLYFTITRVLNLDLGRTSRLEYDEYRHSSHVE